MSYPGVRLEAHDRPNRMALVHRVASSPLRGVKRVAITAFRTQLRSTNTITCVDVDVDVDVVLDGDGDVDLDASNLDAQIILVSIATTRSRREAAHSVASPRTIFSCFAQSAWTNARRDASTRFVQVHVAVAVKDDVKVKVKVNVKVHDGR